MKHLFLTPLLLGSFLSIDFGGSLSKETTRWITPLNRQCIYSKRSLLRRRLFRLNSLLLKNINKIQIDQSNYAERSLIDVTGRKLETNPSLIVIHETVYGVNSVINTFQTFHPNDNDQVSYHMLVSEKGEIYQTVHSDQRAFGAGNSSFNGESVITKKGLASSVNNFALHVSLETPIDGEDNDEEHTGYTQEQYDSLAIILSMWMEDFSIPFDRITTHNFVDLSGSRLCPRSFKWSEVQSRLALLGKLC